MPLTLANRLTLLRLLAIPAFILFLIYYDLSFKAGATKDFYRLIAAAIFACTVLLDALDGYIARSRNQVTRLGTILDPLADKALLLSALIFIGRPSVESFTPGIPVWFTLLAVSRDLFLIFGAIIIHFISGTVRVKPHLIGKATTCFQMATIGWVLLKFPEQPFFVLVGITSALIVISLVIYTIEGIRQMEHA